MAVAIGRVRKGFVAVCAVVWFVTGVYQQVLKDVCPGLGAVTAHRALPGPHPHTELVVAFGHLNLIISYIQSIVMVNKLHKVILANIYRTKLKPVYYN